MAQLVHLLLLYSFIILPCTWSSFCHMMITYIIFWYSYIHMMCLASRLRNLHTNIQRAYMNYFISSSLCATLFQLVSCTKIGDKIFSALILYKWEYVWMCHIFLNSQWIRILREVRCYVRKTKTLVTVTHKLLVILNCFSLLIGCVNYRRKKLLNKEKQKTFVLIESICKSSGGCGHFS